MAVSGIDLGKYKLGWSDGEQFVYKPKKGLNEDVVRDISHQKNEPSFGMTYSILTGDAAAAPRSRAWTM